MRFLHRSARAMGVVGILGALLALPGVGAAQDATESQWTLEDHRGGFCIWYLADPAMVDKLVEEKLAFSPAGAGEGLPASLSRVIRDEAQFANWIPAQLCIGLYGSATIDGRLKARVAAGRAILVGTSVFKSINPRGIDGVSYFLGSILTDQGGVSKGAGDAGLQTSGISLTAKKLPETDDDRVEIRIGGTRIIWIGRHSTEKSVETTRSMSFGYLGSRAAPWKATIESSPAESNLMIGALRIEGKSDLAKVLKASPIRAVGPYETGGKTTLRFDRIIRKSN